MRTLFTLILSLIISSLMAQNNGAVVYFESTKLNIELPEEMKEMIANIPTERTAEKELFFKDGQSLYKNSSREGANEDTELEGGGGGMQFKFKMSEPENQTFCDHSSKSYTKKQDLLGKTFLIQDDLKKINWKLGSNKRQILDYVCMKASAEIDDETNVVAWFTPSIPIPMGPETYHGLPGLILALEINGDEQIIVAKEVSLGDMKDDMEIPKKGKKVNQDEFDQIREEKMKEMGATSGGRGVKVITHSRSNN